MQKNCIFKGLLYQRTMKINTRKILATIGLLIATAVGPLYVFGQSTYTLVTSESDLVAGEAYIIVGEKNGDYKAMGNQKTNNRNAVTVTVSNNKISTTTATEESDGNNVFEFILGGTTDNWTIQDKISSNFLYTPGKSNNNYLKSTNKTDNDNAIWSIKIGSNGIDTITSKDASTNNSLRYNSSSSIFSGYASTSSMAYVYLYKKSNEPTTDETPPKFSTDYPKTENITKNCFDLKVKTDEPCTVFYKVVADGGTTPTMVELLASDKTISVETKNTEYSITVSELASEATYNVYMIAKDAANNVQDDITSVSVTTLSAFVKTIALGDIETKYYWGETATINWTTNIETATNLDSIIIYKGNQKILKYPIDITSREADIRIGNSSAPDGNTYGTDYRLKIISGNVESELSAKFTIVPTITINRLLTDINTGQSDFINDNVRMKGLVTGVKSKALTIQDGMGDFCATYITNNPNTSVKIHDSVYWEVAVSQSTGSIKATTKQITIINRDNQPQTPRITELGEIDVNNGLKYLVVTIEGVICQNKVFYKDNDAIHYINTLFIGNNGYFKENRKYNISGVLNIGAENKKEIWPRSQVPEDFYLYSNDPTLAGLTIGGRNAMSTDTVVFTDLNISGIAATANDAKASLSIRVNNTIIATSEWEGYNFSPLDSVFVTVTAEDGSTGTYKRVIDCKTLKFSTLTSNSFETGDVVNLSWTSYNIAHFSLVLEIQNRTISLTESAISADLSGWQYTIPNSIFGEGTIKAIGNETVLDCLTINIADTKAPTVIRQNPENGSSNVSNRLYISMVFDEPIVVADGTKLKINDREIPIIAVGDTAIKALANELTYNTLYTISLPNNAICDLAGNAASIGNWTFTTRQAPLPDLYFSEYGEGTSYNKYYEIYNPCDTAVDLSRYLVKLDAFSKTSPRSMNLLKLSGWLLPDDVLVVVNSSASAEIKQQADVINSSTTKFTGDDMLGLFRKDGDDTVMIDVVAPFGNCDVSAKWAVAGVDNALEDHIIVRNMVVRGTTNWAESAGTDSFDSQWTVLNIDNWSDFGRHGIGHGTEIVRMSIEDVAATIDRENATVSAEMPYGTDLTELNATFRLSQGAQIFINETLATETIDFSQPVVATIVAGDGIGRKDWTINVTTAPKPSSDNNILTFNIIETTPVSVEIDTASATIDAVVAYNLDSLKLTPVITIAEFSSVSTTLFKSSKGIFTAKARWNFDEPQSFVVTAQDLTQKVWNVRVSRETTQALTIKEIAKLDGNKIAAAGKPIITEGVVSHIVTTKKGFDFYIQDSTGMWSGTLVTNVDSLLASTLAVGDKIKVSGILKEYYGMTRIEEIEEITVLNSDNKILTDTIIVEDARSSAYQNTIVTIDSVICTGGFDNMYAVRDSTNGIFIYNKYRISGFALEVDSMYRITGIVYYTSADDSYRIVPRSADDIVKLTRPAKPKPEEQQPVEPQPIEPQPQEPDTTTVGIIGSTAIGLTAYTANHAIVIENATSAVSVFDIAGRLIATANPAQRIVINVPKNGIYIVGTRHDSLKVMVK